MLKVHYALAAIAAASVLSLGAARAQSVPGPTDQIGSITALSADASLTQYLGKRFSELPCGLLERGNALCKMFEDGSPVVFRPSQTEIFYRGCWVTHSHGVVGCYGGAGPVSLTTFIHQLRGRTDLKFMDLRHESNSIVALPSLAVFYYKP
ncbi:hypothetical protein ACOTC5_30240 [Achromobacter xylosoxidans]